MRRARAPRPACFADVAGGPGSGEATTSSDDDESEEGSSAGATLDPSVASMSSTSGGPGSGEGSTTSEPPDTEGAPCGAMAEACCQGDACAEGACLPGERYVPGRSDWGGVYLRADRAGGGCSGAPDCAVGNPYADDGCGCPPESTATEVLLHAHCGGEIPDPPPAYRLGICLGDTAAPLTIAGVVYAEGPTCLTPHPQTGTCDCPEDSSRSTLRVISQAVPNMAGDLGFCVRAP